MPRHVGSEIQLIVHAELQILLIGITDPVPTDLDQLPWNAYLKSPSGTSSSEGMSCEIPGILQTPCFDDLSESIDEKSTGEPCGPVLV